jgi:Ni/Co efflux regulator RcnB
MKKLLSVLIAATFAATSVAAFSAEKMKESEHAKESMKETKKKESTHAKESKKKKESDYAKEPKKQ